MVEEEGIEPSSLPCKGSVLAVVTTPPKKLSTPVSGILSHDDHPSKPTTRTLGGPPHRVLSVVAAGGVYLAAPVARDAGGLLHHPFTLTTQ